MGQIVKFREQVGMEGRNEGWAGLVNWLRYSPENQRRRLFRDD